MYVSCKYEFINLQITHMFTFYHILFAKQTTYHIGQLNSINKLRSILEKCFHQNIVLYLFVKNIPEIRQSKNNILTKMV